VNLLRETATRQDGWTGVARANCHLIVESAKLATTTRTGCGKALPTTSRQYSANFQKASLDNHDEHCSFSLRHTGG
jgi:hypothetical protein